MKIVFTGGGTSGHVTPNIALFEPLKKEGFELFYIGTQKGIENNLIKEENIPFYEIEAGKLRRYIDMENVKDVGRIMKGTVQARKILKEIKPDVIFSKGGFVSCPVVWAAKSLKIPVIIHESDITPGLANKLSIPSADKVCCAFPETKKYLPEGKSVYTGLPVREEILSGDAKKGESLCGFDGTKPTLLVMGGSLGSEFLNTMVRANLESLTEIFDICHLCGKGHIDESLLNIKGYCQFEYLNHELKDVMAMADMVVSRAGATAIFEILELKKPALLIPLSRKASRGDQIDNSKSFKAQGFCEYAEEENLTGEIFVNMVKEIFVNKDKYIECQKNAEIGNSIETIVNLLKETAERK